MVGAVAGKKAEGRNQRDGEAAHDDHHRDRREQGKHKQRFVGDEYADAGLREIPTASKAGEHDDPPVNGVKPEARRLRHAGADDHRILPYAAPNR